jgi:hypothetical protein
MCRFLMRTVPLSWFVKLNPEKSVLGMYPIPKTKLLDVAGVVKLHV